MNKVILVDKEDRELGELDKLVAHRGKGRLHRAVSVMLFRDGEVLLQKRSQKKLLWPGYWSNVVCTHPQKGEGYEAAGARRLKEEMGIEIEVEKLKLVKKFIYKASFGDKGSEFELDGIVVGDWNGEVRANKDEVEEWKWMKWEELKREIESDIYTPWLKKIVKDWGEKGD